MLNVNFRYRKVSSSRLVYYSILNCFGQRSQYISIEIPLHYQSEKDCMCFKTRWASTRDYTVLEIKKITLTKNNLFFNSLQRGKEKEVRSCLLIFFLPQFNLTKFKRIYFFFCLRQNDHIGWAISMPFAKGKNIKNWQFWNTHVFFSRPFCTSLYTCNIKSEFLSFSYTELLKVS